MAGKVIVYICCTLDGFIATMDDDISWLSLMEKEGEDYGYANFTSGISGYFVGRKTYDVVMKLVGHFPPAQTFDCYVVSRMAHPASEGITYWRDSIPELVQHLKATHAEKDIFCDGGAQIIAELFRSNLLDRLIIFRAPILLGKGKRLFQEGLPETRFNLLEMKSYDTGMVKLTYEPVDLV